MKNFKKRWTAWLLMFSLIFSALPVNALAYDGGVEDQVIEIALGDFYDFSGELEAAGRDGLWESGNSAIVSISEDGVADALAVGETTVSFTVEKMNLGEAPEMTPVEDEQVTNTELEETVSDEVETSGDDVASDDGNIVGDEEIVGDEVGGAVNEVTGDDADADDNAIGGDEAINEGGFEEDGSADSSDEAGADSLDDAANDSGSDNDSSSDDSASDDGGAADDGSSDDGAADSSETDGAYTMAADGDLIVYTWTVRVYDPNLANYAAYAQLIIGYEEFGSKLDAFQEAYYAGLAEDSFDENGDMTEEAMNAFMEAAAAELGSDFNSLVELYKQIPARFSDEAAEAAFPEYAAQYRAFRGLAATLAVWAEYLGGDMENGIMVLAGDDWANVKGRLESGTSVTLQNNISGNSTITITKNATLDLNGHTMTFNGDTSKDAKQTISENKYIGSNGSVIYVKQGTFTLNGTGGGTITGGKGLYFYAPDVHYYKGSQGIDMGSCGGGVFVGQNAKFVMNGGTISGNTADTGGGVFIARNMDGSVHGEFEMYGGNIQNNTASKHEGGGICNHGKATIYPLKSNINIINNKTNTTGDLGGGGVFVESKGTMSIINAVITNNKANGLGGGVAGCLHGMISNLTPDTAAIFSNQARLNPNIVKFTPGDPTTGGLGNLVDHDGDSNNKPLLSWTQELVDSADDYFCAGYSSIGKLALNGANADWSGYAIYRAGGKSAVNSSTSDPIVVQGLCALKVTNPEVVRNAANSFTGKKVTISGNTSAMHGGGVASNGILTFGQYTEEFNYSTSTITLEATKNVTSNKSGESLSKEGYTFQLLKGNTVLGTATSDNNGKIVFSNLLSSTLFGDSKKNGEISTTLTLREIVPANKTAGMIYDEADRTIELKVSRISTKDTVSTNSGKNKVTTYVFTDTLQSATANGIQAEINGNKVILAGDANFTNKMEYGSLQVTKTVTGDTLSADANDEFTFKVTLTGPEGQTANLANVGVTGEGFTLVGSSNGVISFKLKAGKTATISNIPVGVRYTVEETAFDGSKYEKVGGEVSGVAIVKGDNKVNVTNQRNTAALSVQKEVTVAANSAEWTGQDDRFVIEVKLGDSDEFKTGEGYAGAAAGDFAYAGAGRYHFVLAHEETATITGVPTGMKYLVSEKDMPSPDDADYVNTNKMSLGNSAELNENATVVVQNEYYKKQYTSVEVEKKFDGGYRPQSVTVRLNGGPDALTDEFRTVTLNAANKWTASWDNLDKYPGKTGEAYTYTVEEIGVVYSNGATGYDVDAKDGNLFRVRSRQNKTPEGVAEIVGGWMVSEGAVTNGKAVITNKWYPADAIGSTSFKVVKIDSESQKPIAGVEFTLSAKAQIAGFTDVVQTTNEQGEIVFSGLKPGVYILQETAVPEAYDTVENLSQEFELVVGKQLESVEELTPNVDNQFVGKNNWNWQAAVGDQVGEITVENTMVKGNISITKAIADEQGYINPADFDGKEFKFKVFGRDAKGGVINEELTVTTSVQTGKIVSTTATTGELPFGYYTIAEAAPEAVDGYNYIGIKFPNNDVAGANNYQVKIDSSHKSVDVTATNVYERQTGDLSIRKIVGGDRGDKNADWNFEIKLVGVTAAMNLAGDYPLAVYQGTTLLENAADSVSFVADTDPDGNVSYIGNIVLKDSQTATISGLPVGVKYVVTEAEADANYYNTKAENASGNILIENTPVVVFTNTLNERDIPTWSNIEVQKVWANDADHPDTRPASIEVQLLRDGEVQETVTLNAENAWHYTWEHMNTKHYTWEVKEVGQVNGYNGSDAVVTTKTVNGTAVREYTITNTFINPDEFVVEKTWVGDTAAERPAEIMVQLYDGETPYGEAVVLTAADGWRYTWTELPIRRDWRVQEVETPANYSSEVAYAEGKATITNTYHQPLTVNKVWVGGNEANRPAEITVQLYNGNEPYGETVQLTAADGWSYTWTMLPLDGNWRVVETTVPEGYHAVVSGVVNGVITVINTYDEGNDNPGGDNPGGGDPGGDNDTTIPDNETPLSEYELLDDDVPLAYLPDDSDEEIFDEEIPLADVPTTGDDSGRWLALVMSSGLAGLLLSLIGRKRRNEAQD